MKFCGKLICILLCLGKGWIQFSRHAKPICYYFLAHWFGPTFFCKDKHVLLDYNVLLHDDISFASLDITLWSNFVWIFDNTIGWKFSPITSILKTIMRFCFVFELSNVWFGFIVENYVVLRGDSTGEWHMWIINFCYVLGLRSDYNIREKRDFINESRRKE